MNIASPSLVHSMSVYKEDMHDGPKIPIIIKWNHGGMEVYVVGSWDNWRNRKRMRRIGKEFVVMRKVPPGVYQYKFIVDRQWMYAPDVPWELDATGSVCNIIDVKGATGSITNFEPPQSPESSYKYNNCFPGPEDSEKEPPMVPPHLEYTLLNTPAPDMEISPPFAKPQHVVLDHLYIQKKASTPSVVALGSTNWFHSKYVTVVL